MMSRRVVEKAERETEGDDPRKERQTCKPTL